MSTLNITIFGTGAMGTLIASRLDFLKSENKKCIPEINVNLFGTWKQQVEKIRKQGLTLEHIDGSRSIHHLNITDNIGNLPASDIVIVLVKSYQTDRVAREIPQILAPAGIVITLQNGLGNRDILCKTIDSRRVGQGVTLQGATVVEAGMIRHTAENSTYLAPQPETEESIEQMAMIFRAAGLKTYIVDNAESMIWGKLAINIGVNPLTALLEVQNGELADNVMYRRIVALAVREVKAVACKLGISLPYSDPYAATISACHASATNYSSMLQDILNNRPTEIDSMCGEVIRLSERTDVRMPVNKFLLEHVKAKEQGIAFKPELLRRVVQEN
ncbi:2-dehydropantoate 2-reductase [candidate division KSB1 bacterium]|nr:2-dehydropantoate 2-reductase [candidate division KSB1 bacterium]